MPSVSFASRRVRYSPSRANSTAAAACSADCSPSGTPSRPSSSASFGIVPSWPRRAGAGGPGGGGGRAPPPGPAGPPATEVLLQAGEVQAGAARPVGLRGRLPQQVLEDLPLTLVVRVGARVGELHLLPARGHDDGRVDDPRDRAGPPGDRGPSDGG